MIGTKTISPEQIFSPEQNFSQRINSIQPNYNPQRRVFAFLEQVAKETRVSRGKARLDLARKMNERSRLVETRKKQRQRLRKLAKNLETTEASARSCVTFLLIFILAKRVSM